MTLPTDTLPTRETLILRLRDREDQRAWEEFAEIYTPLLCGFCRKRGLAPEDLADVVQEVMRSVSLAMGDFRYDPEKGKFKAWLFTAVRRAVYRHFRKQARRPVPATETQLVHGLDRDPAGGEEVEWDRDYRRRLLAWAMEKVKPEFSERIWRAFELTAVQDKSIGEAAEEIGMTRNAVSIAKSRVISRLREKARSVDEDQWEAELEKNQDCGKKPRSAG